MPSTKRVVRRFIVATTAVAAMAIPLQAGAAHADPNDDLTTCLNTAITNLVGDDFTAAVNTCVDTYLQEIGIDPTTMTLVNPPAADPTDSTVTDVTAGTDTNTGILGTVDGSDGTTSSAD